MFMYLRKFTLAAFCVSLSFTHVLGATPESSASSTSKKYDLSTILISVPPSSSSSSFQPIAPTSEKDTKAQIIESDVKLKKSPAPQAIGKGFAPIPSVNEPSYVTEQRQLIMGKQFTIEGIALFSGTDTFSTAIRTLTASNWSHVGLRLSDAAGLLYCFESTGSPDQILKGMLPQVQIHTWNDVVKGYSGSVGFRQFTLDSEAWTKEKTNGLTNWVLEKLGTPYEKDMGSLLKAIKGSNTAESSRSLFCSELVAFALIQFGLLPEKGKDNYKQPDNFLPRHFSETDYLPWIHAKLGKEQIAKKGDSGCCSCVIL